MINSALIIDDDSVFCEALCNAMKKRNVNALSASNAQQAMEAFREKSPDLVMLDYRMPERDGLSLLREMHSLRPSAVYIMLSGYGDVPTVVEAMQQGADNFLSKPCDADSILREAYALSEKKKKKLAGYNPSELRSFNLDVLEKTGIEKALKATKGNVSKSAVLLGIDRRTLQRKMKRMFSFALFGVLSFGLSATMDAEAKVGKEERTRFINLTGDDTFLDDRSAWDKTYSREEYVFGKEPAEFLQKHSKLLKKGRVLDIAMGEGRNAVFLAKRGFRVEGVDISEIGLRKARVLAAENGVFVKTINADLNKYRIKRATYDVILNFYYFQRNLFTQIKNGLKEGGLIVYETYTLDQLKNKSGEKWEEKYLIRPGELKAAFSDFEILYYAETNDGTKAVASLIARKPAKK